jgi:hypothetical protein
LLGASLFVGMTAMTLPEDKIAMPIRVTKGEMSLD